MGSRRTSSSNSAEYAKKPVYAERTDDFVLDFYRYADKRGVLFGHVPARTGPVEETGFVGYSRYEHRFTGLHHAPGDPFAGPVPAALALAYLEQQT